MTTITLTPVRINNQIEDAINAYDIRKDKEFIDKYNTCIKYLHYIDKINNATVKDVEIKGYNIYYRFAGRSRKVYYYPIQYAKIEIDTILR